MSKNIEQKLETMDIWLNEISKHNDITLKVTDNLHIILLNLKILNAHSRVLGIDVAIDELERNVTTLHDSTKDMVNKGRKELRESFNNIKEYINKKEGIE